MSKSLGNGVDPMDVIDKYGADALRYFLSTGSSPGQDLRFSFEKVESTWNFANKIWNASRFALMNMDGMTYEEIDFSGEKSVADKWILTQLNETIETVTKLSERYEFGEAGRALYNFIWDDFCDWYIEMAKLPLYGDDEAAKKTTRSILAHVLDQTMRLLHPFMPFITEEIWQNLPHAGESITTAKWPEVNPAYSDETAAQEMKMLMEMIRSVRNIRAEVNTPMSKKIKMLVKAKDASVLKAIEKNRAYIEKFCNPEELQMGTNLDTPEKAMTAVITGLEIILPLEGLINIEEEIARLTKEYDKFTKEVERVEKKLNNEGFMKKAPESVVVEERAKEKDYREKRALVEARLNELKGL
jgi:valyl-tRNA synthetase